MKTNQNFLYVLHDCEFDFTESKLHGNEIVTGGFGIGPTTTPATLDLNVIFKSYSRILVPGLITSSSVKDSLIFRL